MKKLFLSLTIIFLFGSNAFGFDHSYTGYRTLLGKSVDNGLVDYKKIQSNPKILQDALLDFSELSKKGYESFDRSQKIAYMINAYNLYTIEGILKEYPVKSIKDIKGIWNKAKHKVAGQMLTLDNIEHDILRKQFKEERIHIAIVCASIACPEIWNQPFTADSLDQQLTARAERFVTDMTRNKISFEKHELKLSKILSWYGNDFKEKYSDDSIFLYLYGKKRAVANFIYNHSPKETQEKLRQGKFKVGYLSYDWNLNEQ